MSPWFTLALIFVTTSCLLADGRILKETLKAEAPGRPIALANADLEQVAGDRLSSWQPYGEGYSVDAEVRHGGRHSARCENTSADQRRGLVQVVELNQKAPIPVLAECWSKAKRVSEGSPGDYSLYLDLEYTDGTPLWGQIAPFEAGTHDWQHARVLVIPEKPIKRITINALLRNRTGVAWFDGFKLWESTPPDGFALFDSVPVALPCASWPAITPKVTLRTEDGLALPFDPARSEVYTSQPGGFFFRDVGARSDFVQPAGFLQQQPDGTWRYQGQDEGLKLRLTATFRVAGRAIHIDGELEDLTGKDRAITLYFSYPVNAIGWQWYDDQRTSRAIEPRGKYGNFVGSGVGANGLASRYPLACISGDNDAAAIALPLDVPRLCRLGFDADSRELYAALDLGLTPDTKRFPSRASFSLVLYRPDPKWGFRSALARYYELFPSCFAKRNQKEGIWMPFSDIAKVEGFEDFGFQFKEGDNNVAFDAAHGIYSFVYVEPWSDWVSMPKEMPRTVEAATAYVKQRAAEGSQKDQAVLSSAFEAPDGAWAGRIENQPWCDGAVFGVNPSPGVPAQAGHVTQFDNLMRSIDGAFERSPQLTGVYHDSFEMYLFSNYPNYRREHFREAAIPLVFDAEGRVCQYAMFDMVEFARTVAERVWPRGGMTFANGTPHSFPWGAAWLDVMGTEAAWASSWGSFGNFVGEPASALNYWRALCYQRPYLMLLNTRFDLWKPEWFELYMKRCAAWAVFPSMFSHNASEDPYWQNAALYNRDRPLFKKYLPVISKLSAAGWEPVTYARSDNPRVYVERFGRPGGPLYFTVFNDSDGVQRAKIAFDLSDLRAGAGELRLDELLSGAGLAASPANGLAVLEIEIEAGDVKVLAL